TVPVDAGGARPLMPEHLRPSGKVSERSALQNSGVEDPITYDGEGLVVEPQLVVKGASVEESNWDELIEPLLVHEQRGDGVRQKQFSAQLCDGFAPPFFPDDFDAGDHALTIGVLVEVGDGLLEEGTAPTVVIVVEDEVLTRCG